MKVEVLNRHIYHGQPCIEERCPIALAILDALGAVPVSGVFVGSEVVTILLPDGNEKIIPLPWEINEIIDEYDATGVMYPFGFEL